MNPHLGEEWQLGLEAVPDPSREHLARGVLQSFDLVEAVVVELEADRLQSSLDIAVIHEVVPFRGDVSLHDDIHAKGVAVHAAALMAIGEIRQVVGGLEAEGFDEANPHRGDDRKMAGMFACSAARS